MVTQLLVISQRNFAKASLTDSPHRSIFEAAKNLNIEVTIDGKKASAWNKQTENRYFESGDEVLTIKLLTKPKRTLKVWWKDDRKIVKCK